jgi:hypothetical protein
MMHNDPAVGGQYHQRKLSSVDESGMAAGRDVQDIIANGGGTWCMTRQSRRGRGFMEVRPVWCYSKKVPRLYAKGVTVHPGCVAG